MDRREQLLQWAQQQGITWTELSRKLDFSLSYITRMAAGERKITDGFLWRFAQCYGWEATKQVFGEDCPGEATQ
jgi:plasmid maintenance system antidote protein VapI